MSSNGPSNEIGCDPQKKKIVGCVPRSVEKEQRPPLRHQVLARRVQKHKRVAKPLMVGLSTIMIDELGAGPARRS